MEVAGLPDLVRSVFVCFICGLGTTAAVAYAKCGPEDWSLMVVEAVVDEESAIFGIDAAVATNVTLDNRGLLDDLQAGEFDIKLAVQP